VAKGSSGGSSRPSGAPSFVPTARSGSANTLPSPHDSIPKGFPNRAETHPRQTHPPRNATSHPRSR
jgi:hypothetical protein